MVGDAVADAISTALADGSLGFDFRANVYTLICITGVVLYWRGVWTLWCVLCQEAVDRICVYPVSLLTADCGALTMKGCAQLCTARNLLKIESFHCPLVYPMLPPQCRHQ